MKKKRKIGSIIVFLLVSTVFFGCEKLDFTQFTMDYTSEFTYSGGLGIAIPFTARTPEISSNSSSTFSANNTRKDKVEEVNLQSMRLEIKTPADADFDFLNEITISINADGLSEKVIATKTNIPEERLTSLEMDVEGSVNLKDYVTSDQFTFKTTTKTDKTISNDITVTIKSVFFVDAKVL